MGKGEKRERGESRKSGRGIQLRSHCKTDNDVRQLFISCMVPYMGSSVSALLTVKLNVSDPVVTLYKVLEALLTMGLGGQGTS